MEVTTISLIIAGLAFIFSLLIYFQLQQVKKSAGRRPQNAPFSTLPLQLQAYERLVVLCERIALPNLISRVSQPDLSVKEMQVFLLENIKQEFEYNASQQVYVSPVAWDAVRNLKDQNMLIINQIASVLPETATARDLNRKLLEVVMQEEQKPLHSAVLETLNFEARRLFN